MKSFKKVKNIVKMPVKDGFGNIYDFVEKDKEFYVYLGKITKLGNKKIGAYPTNYKYENGETVWAVPMKGGHGTTSSFYSKDGFNYVMANGIIYKSSTRTPLGQEIFELNKKNKKIISIAKELSKSLVGKEEKKDKNKLKI